MAFEITWGDMPRFSPAAIIVDSNRFFARRQPLERLLGCTKQLARRFSRDTRPRAVDVGPSFRFRASSQLKFPMGGGVSTHLDITSHSCVVARNDHGVLGARPPIGLLVCRIVAD